MPFLTWPELGQVTSAGHSWVKWPVPAIVGSSDPCQLIPGRRGDLHLDWGWETWPALFSTRVMFWDRSCTSTYTYFWVGSHEMFSTVCTVGGMDLEPTSKRRLIWVMDFYCRHLLWGFLDLIYESSLWKVLTLKLFGAGLHLEYRHAFDRFSNTVSWSLLGNKLIAITWKLSWAGLYLEDILFWVFT